MRMRSNNLPNRVLMKTPIITPRAALVTGANRGLGAALVEALLAAGVPRIYAGYRSTPALPDPPSRPGVIYLPLDVTQPGQVAAAVEAAPDVDFLINNAGVLPRGGPLEVSEQGLQDALDVNYLGPLRMVRGFLPVLERNGEGTILNILSLLSFFMATDFVAYCASKWAGRAMTEALAAELAPRGVRVLAAYPGGIDTDMLAHLPATKSKPADVAAAIIASALRGESEIFPDPESQRGRVRLGR